MTSSPPSGPEAGWYSDPAGRYVYRYWDGTQWTSQVNSGAANMSDPLEPDMARTPPIPGSAAQSRQPQEKPQQPTVQVSTKGGSSTGSIIAVVLAVAALILVLVLAFGLLSGDDDSTDTTPAPTPTTQPAETTPPEEG